MPEAPTPQDPITQCMICLEAVDPNDPNVSRLGCDHVFHATCLVPHSGGVHLEMLHSDAAQRLDA